MTTTKLSKNQQAALDYINRNGRMLVRQQGLGALTNGAKALLAKGLIRTGQVDLYGETYDAYLPL